jgi:MOSC domain-containing protein
LRVCARAREKKWWALPARVGEEMGCNNFQRTLWCVTSTLAQKEIPRDLGILRTLAHHHDWCLGVYATVSNPGVVRVGDEVALRAP